MSHEALGEQFAVYSKPLKGLAGDAARTGTLDAYKTIHEAHLGFDEPGSVCDALNKSTATTGQIASAHRQIYRNSQEGLERDGFPEQFTVHRSGEVNPNRVVSVSTRPLETFKNPHRYTVARSDVLTYGDGLPPGTFSEHEMHVVGSKLRQA